MPLSSSVAAKLLYGAFRMPDVTRDAALIPPQPTARDIVHAGAKGFLGEFPGGSTAGELLSFLFGPSLERRQREWQDSVARAIEELRERQIDVASLCSEGPFVDVVIAASRAAIATSQDAKREALRNAILNSALPGAPDEGIQQVFLSMIDRFTAWHLIILNVYSKPRDWLESNRPGEMQLKYLGSLEDVLLIAFPELRHKREFYSRLWADLWAAGLVETEVLHAGCTPEGALVPRLTDWGKQFLKFVSAPQ
jgi:hypothetical protein